MIDFQHSFTLFNRNYIDFKISINPLQNVNQEAIPLSLWSTWSKATDLHTLIKLQQINIISNLHTLFHSQGKAV